MRERILKIMLNISLIVTLVGAQFILLGNHVVLAINEELENQTTQTNNKNVSLDVFFEEENGKVRSTIANIQEGAIMNVKITATEGILSNANLEVSHNLVIQKDKIQNEYISSIDEQTGSIKLNSIANNETVQIKIPVKLRKEEQMNIGYFDQETQIKLTGNYKKGDKTPQSIEGMMKVKINWTQDATLLLEQKVEKFIPVGKDKLLIQQKIETGVVDNVLPKESETLEIQAPKIQELYPNEIVVLKNNEKLEGEELQYDATTGAIKISTKNAISENNTITWKNGTDIYKIGYCYSNEIGLETKNVIFNTKLKTKLLSKDEMEISKEEELQVSPNGTIVGIEKQMTTSIAKGYLYVKSAKETNYEEKISLEVSKAEELPEITINNGDENFETEQGTKYVADVYTKEIIFDKQNLINILGEKFAITIQSQDGNIITTIDENTKTKEDGKIHVEIEKEKGKKIMLKISAPVKEGCIEINMKKAIPFQENYAKEKTKTFTKLVTTSNLTMNDNQVTAISQMELKDTTSEATLNISEPNWSTVQATENVQITGILKSNNETHDLYKNPVIQFQFPAETEKIEVKSINKLYADEFEFGNARLYEQEKRIDIELKGEQTEFKSQVQEGIQVVINANITMKKMQASKNSEMLITYTNGNRLGEQMQAKTQVKINSKYGVSLYNSIQGYNEQNEKIETISDETINGKLDTKKPSKQAKIETAVINNYENSISNVAIIGKLPSTEDGIVKSDIITNLASKINVENGQAKIYYSTENTEANSDKWKTEIEDITKVKLFKIEIPEIKAGETIAINYNVMIPENLEGNKVAYESTQLNYLYAGQTKEQYSIIKLSTMEEATQEETEIKETKETEDIKGIQVETIASTPGKNFTMQDDVYEGQIVKYNVKLKNNTGKDLSKFSLTATQTDALRKKKCSIF